MNRIESNRIESNRIESNRIESNRIESNRVEPVSFFAFEYSDLCLEDILILIVYPDYPYNLGLFAPSSAELCSMPYPSIDILYIVEYANV